MNAESFYADTEKQTFGEFLFSTGDKTPEKTAIFYTHLDSVVEVSYKALRQKANLVSTNINKALEKLPRNRHKVVNNKKRNRTEKFIDVVDKSSASLSLVPFNNAIVLIVLPRSIEQIILLCGSWLLDHVVSCLIEFPISAEEFYKTCLALGPNLSLIITSREHIFKLQSLLKSINLPSKKIILTVDEVLSTSVLLEEGLICQPYENSQITKQTYPQDAERPKLIVFSSGTSKKICKPVVLSQRNIIYRTGIARDILGVNATSVSAVWHSCNFIDFYSTVLPFIAYGGSVVLTDKNKLLQFSYFSYLLASLKVTHLTAIPSVLLHLHSDSIQCVVSSGETLTLSAVTSIKKCLNPTNFFNLYGSTESTGDCLGYRILISEGIQTKNENIKENKQISVPIGQPLTTDTHVKLNPKDKTLIISSPLVAMGHLNCTEKSSFLVPYHNIWKSDDEGRMISGNWILNYERPSRPFKAFGLWVHPACVGAVLQAKLNTSVFVSDFEIQCISKLFLLGQSPNVNDTVNGKDSMFGSHQNSLLVFVFGPSLHDTVGQDFSEKTKKLVVDILRSCKDNSQRTSCVIAQKKPVRSSSGKTDYEKIFDIYWTHTKGKWKNMPAQTEHEVDQEVDILRSMKEILNNHLIAKNDDLIVDWGLDSLTLATSLFQLELKLGFRVPLAEIVQLPKVSINSITKVLLQMGKEESTGNETELASTWNNNEWAEKEVVLQLVEHAEESFLLNAQSAPYIETNIDFQFECIVSCKLYVGSCVDIPLTVDNQKKIFTAGYSNTIQCFCQQGHVWSRKVNDKVLVELLYIPLQYVENRKKKCEKIICEGLIIAATLGGLLIAFSSNDGHLIWFNRSPPENKRCFKGSLIEGKFGFKELSKSLVYASCYKGFVYGVCLQTGDTKLVISLKEGGACVGLTSVNQKIKESLLFVSQLRGIVLCYKIICTDIYQFSFNLLWKYSNECQPIFSLPVLYNEMLILLYCNGKMVAVNVHTGGIEWKTVLKSEKHLWFGSPQLFTTSNTPRLVAISKKTHLVIINPETGHIECQKTFTDELLSHTHTPLISFKSLSNKKVALVVSFRRQGVGFVLLNNDTEPSFYPLQATISTESQIIKNCFSGVSIIKSQETGQILQLVLGDRDDYIWCLNLKKKNELNNN